MARLFLSRDLYLLEPTRVNIIMETYEIDSCVRGFHVYKESWAPSLGDEHECQRERGNSEDPYAVAVMHRRLGVVGHVPRLISAACSLFLRIETNTIKCRIELGNITILSFIMISKYHDNQYRREIFSIVISDSTILS